MAKKFPKTLFVKWEQPGSDEPFLASYQTAEETAELGSVETVAVYRLERVTKVSTNIRVK